MFDWPEQTQTSPTRTFLMVKVLLPVIVRSNGPPGFNGPIFVAQLPVLSVNVFAFLPAISIETSSPGSPWPQTRTCCPLCSTMLSPITDGTVILANASCWRRTVRKTVIRTNNDLGVVMIFYSNP